MSKSGVVVKKVNPYPFAASLTLANPQAIPGNVLKLTLDGALVDIGTAFAKVGSVGVVTFVLPTFGRQLQVQVKVLKSQDRTLTTKAVFTSEQVAAMKGQQGSPMENSARVQITRIIEVRFLVLSDADRAEITQFLTVIKQVD